MSAASGVKKSGKFIFVAPNTNENDTNKDKQAPIVNSRIVSSLIPDDDYMLCGFDGLAMHPIAPKKPSRKHFVANLDSEKPNLPVSSEYVILDDDANACTLKQVLENWHIANHKLFFIFAGNDMYEKYFWELLMKTTSKAADHKMNIACVIISQGRQDFVPDPLEAFPDNMHCLRVFIQDEDMVNIAGDVVINCSFEPPTFYNDPDNEDCEYLQLLHPVIKKYIITHQSLAQFMSMATEFDFANVAVVLGDNASYGGFDGESWGYIRHLPTNTSLFKETLFMCRDCDTTDWSDTATFIHLLSFEPDTLFLKLVEHSDAGDGIKKHVVVKGNVVKMGTVYSHTLSPEDLYDDNQELLFCKKYCVWSYSGGDELLPSLITTDLPKFDRLIALHPKKDKKTYKIEVEEHAHNTIYRLKCQDLKDTSADTLYVIFDQNGMLFSKRDEMPMVQWERPGHCIAIVPLAKLKLGSWDPKLQSVERFPICDWNCSVDTYIFVDGGDILTHQNRFKNSFEKYVTGKLLVRGEQGTICAKVVYEATNNVSTAVISTRQNDFVGISKPYDTDSLPYLAAVIDLLTTDNESTDILGSCDTIRSSFTEMKFERSRGSGKAYFTTFVMRVALSLLKRVKLSDEDEARGIFSIVSDAIHQISHDAAELFEAENDECERYLTSVREILRVITSDLKRDDCAERRQFLVHRQINVIKSYDLLTRDVPLKPKHWSLLRRVHHPESELFFAAVFSGNGFAAEEFLRHTNNDELVANALFAIGVFKKELGHSPSKRAFAAEDDHDRLRQSADVFEEHAKGIIRNVYSQNKYASHSLLFRKLERYQDSTTFDLACMAEARSFLSDTACTSAIYDTWWGNLSMSSWRTVVLLMFLPFLSRCLIKSDKEKNHVDRASRCCEYNVYRIPAVKCIFHAIVFTAFLGAFCYAVLTGTEEKIERVEYCIFIWMLSILLEEVIQMKQIFNMGTGLNACTKIGIYMWQFWNILDVFAIGLFLLGAAFRLASFYSGRQTLHLACHACFALDIIVLHIRTLQFFAMHKKIGPLFITVRYMFQDLAYFIVIVMVVMIGYGVALQSTTSKHYSNLSWSMINDILQVPYFQMYGETGLEALADPSADGVETTSDELVFRKYFGLLLASVYLLFVNILLLNLLIALFNSSYMRVAGDSAFHNVIHQIEVLNEYKDKSVLPPPLVLFHYAMMLPFKLCKKIAARVSSKTQESDFQFKSINLDRIIKLYFDKQKETNERAFSAKTFQKQFDSLLRKADEHGFELQRLQRHMQDVSEAVFNRKADNRRTRSKCSRIDRNSRVNKVYSMEGTNVL